MIKFIDPPEIFIGEASRLECENPSDARHRDDLVADYLRTNILTQSNLEWLACLIERQGARFQPYPGDLN